MQRKTKAHGQNIRKLVISAMLCAITLLLGLTPLGFIPLGPVRLTIMHIPLLIGLLAEGLPVGLIVAGLFGGFSMYQAYAMPTSPIQFIFLDVRVALLPRLLIPLIAYGVFMLLMRLNTRREIAWGGAALVGSLTNTVGVLLAAYVIYAVRIGEAMSLSAEGVLTFMLGIAATNGIPEAIAATIISVSVMKALSAAFKF